MFLLEQQQLLAYLLRAGLLGVIFAFIYHLFGFQRLVTAGITVKMIRFTIQFFIDLFYWSMVAFADILMVYNANRGKVRILALLIEMAGFLLCYLPLKETVRKIESIILRYINKQVFLPLARFCRKQVEKMKRKINSATNAYKIRRYNEAIERTMQKNGEQILKEIEQFFGFSTENDEKKKYSKKKQSHRR